MNRLTLTTNTYTRWSTTGLLVVAFAIGACAPKDIAKDDGMKSPDMADMPTTQQAPMMKPEGPPSPDPRVGLKAGLFDAGEALWNMKMLSTTPPPKD
ncbi:MAG: hypothetical protein R2832_19510, partial [Rhodothermales bacterium]